MMNFIVVSQGRDLGFFRNFNSADFQIRATCENENDNTFEFSICANDYNRDFHKFGNYIYRAGSEEGGIIKIITSTTDGIIRIGGPTWRGILSKKIIQPPEGQDYMTVSGDVHEVIRQLIGNDLGKLFFVRPSAGGVTINAYQFRRYVTLLDGLTAMLSSVNMRLSITYKETVGAIELAAIQIADYSKQEEVSQNTTRVGVEVVDNRAGINHLICLGAGELKERLVIHLYVWPDGSIRDKQYYKGLDEVTETYEYTSESDVIKLKEYGMERMKERMNQKSITINAAEINAEIGDRIGGRDYVTNTSVSAIVSGRITSISDGIEKVTHEVEKGE